MLRLSVGEELSVAKLCNVGEVDCWIPLACEQRLFEILARQGEFPRPFASPYEAVVALGVTEWLESPPGRRGSGYATSVRDVCDLLQPLLAGATATAPGGSPASSSSELPAGSEFAGASADCVRDGETRQCSADSVPHDVWEENMSDLSEEDVSDVSETTMSALDEELFAELKAIMRNGAASEGPTEVDVFQKLLMRAGLGTGTVSASATGEGAEVSTCGHEGTVSKKKILKDHGHQALMVQRENRIFPNAERGWRGYVDEGGATPAVLCEGMIGVASSYDNERATS